MPGFAEFATRIASAALPQKRTKFGPWLGSMRSLPADQVPREYMASGTDFLYEPRQGYWKRRSGQTQKFDTFGASVGLLPAKWSSRCRQLDEFTGEAATDDIPTLIALCTRETVTTGLDDGRFSNVYVRDQVNSTNYTLGDEFGSTTYPVPGTAQDYKFVPLWYDSGDGGITRGVNEFERRMFVGGSRGFLKVGNWHYFPSLYGTPSRATMNFVSGAQLVTTILPNGDNGTCGVSRCVNGFYRDVGSGAQVAMGGSVVVNNMFNCYRDSSGNYDTRTITATTATSFALTSAGLFGEIVAGMQVEGTNIAVGSTVVTKTDNSNLVLSLATTGNGTQSAIFTPAYGYLSVTTANGFDSCIGAAVALSRVDFTLGGTLDRTYGAQYTVNFSISKFFGGTLSANSFLEFDITMSDGTYWKLGPTDLQPLVTDSFQTLSWTGAVETGSPRTANSIRATLSGGGWGATVIAISYISVTLANDSAANRLIPSGPLPPTHAGTLAKGNFVAGGDATKLHPISDDSTGGWTASDGVTTTNLYTYIDEGDTTADPITDDYIRAFGATTSTGVWGLTNLGFTPVSTDTVKLRWRAQRSPSSTTDLTVVLLENSTPIASSQQTVGNFSFTNYEYTLTDAQVSAVTNWDNVRLELISSGGGASDRMYVAWAAVQYEPEGSALGGGWRGADRFLYSVAYRFEDDSVWMPCTPRLPSTTLANGYNMFTLDSTNPTSLFDKVTWSNLPVPPFGVKKKLLLRSTKIDSTADDNLQMNAHDLRIVAEVDASVTTYDDYAADDDALVLDVDKLLIREDHIMPPRSRWIFGGDSRVCHSYGGLNPCAIELVPVGVVADYDLNLADTSGVIYGTSGLPASYFKLDTTNLTLVRDTGAATSTKTFALATYNTLEKLVDAINVTSTADTDWSGGAGKASQWRAQVCPGASPQAVPLTALNPTTRAITSVVKSASTTITKAAGGLSAIPVGAFITGTGITDGTYVTVINSDTQLTMSAVATDSATSTLTFVSGTGDSITGATHATYEGYQRVVANSLPGFLYFNKTYLDQFPVEKSAVWMTVASPGAIKSAPNCFSGLISNKHTPPATAGISMGGVGVDNGFVTPFSLKRAVVRNTRDSGTGLDSDYRLFITNESSGCVGPIVKGPRCALVFTPEGWVGADLGNEVLLSEAVWLHAPTATGDFSYEAPLCIAATAQDNDTAHMAAKVMRGALWVNYRTSGTHPDRQICYDFSTGTATAGLPALLRSNNRPWGWSVPLVRSCSEMAEGRRADGAHLYAWNEANAGSIGDGRIDEIETSDTDNGTAISNSASPLRTPWESLESSDGIAGHEIVFDHSSPTGAVVKGTFTRAFAVDTYTCTPDVSSSLVVSSYRWLLSLAARAPSAACYVGWYQTSGGASELRDIELTASGTRDYKPGTAG